MLMSTTVRIGYFHSSRAAIFSGAIEAANAAIGAHARAFEIYVYTEKKRKRVFINSNVNSFLAVFFLLSISLCSLVWFVRIEGPSSIGPSNRSIRSEFDSLMLIPAHKLVASALASNNQRILAENWRSPKVSLPILLFGQFTPNSRITLAIFH